MSGVAKPTEAELVTMFCAITPLAASIKPVLDEAIRGAQGYPGVTSAVKSMLGIEKRLKNLRHMEALVAAAEKMTRRAF